MDTTNTSDLSDIDVTLHMRKCNYEKFKTLVRMHLSFELDLNTDEFDLPCHEIIYEEKGKVKKWNRISKKHRNLSGSGCASGAKCSASTENSPMEGYTQLIDSGFLFHLVELKSFLLQKRNLTQEGIFRKTGSISRQNELRLHIQKEEPLNLDSGDYSAHDCATVFKAYLADMSEPLLTDAHYPAHLQIAPLCLSTPLNISSNASLMRPERAKKEQHLLNSVQLLLLLLPEENRQLVRHVIEILHSVMQHENINKMSADNLATLFAPHLICPRNLPPEALHYVSKKLSSIIAYMVTKGSIIFDVPAKLITDIRAYFLERKRKKTMSPEQTLDESISDMSTVNTVYTFVDREKTAAAHTANTTDTELAQLYAHIQSLPESSKKRRLIKQFNKQNGQGTPLQLVVMNRLKNPEVPRHSKSISDSIKKHIFHKTLMSRTPKRTNTSVGIETPNMSTAKNPKLRVLFRSPAAEASRSHFSEMSSSTTSLAHASSNTFTTIKPHPLQKSISSYALNSPSLNCAVGESKESSPPGNSVGFLQHNLSSKTTGYSISAPVSRQCSDDFGGQSTSNLENVKHESRISSATPVQTEPAILKNKINNTADNKKSVVWNESNLLKIEEVSNTCTPIQQNTRELKLRFKSEPNLNRILKEKFECIRSGTEINTTTKCGKFLPRKIIKGVSMSNIKLPFNTPDTTKRLVRSVSSTLKRYPSDEPHYESRLNAPLNAGVTPLLEDVDDEDLDDETFEESPDDQLDSYSSTESHNIDEETESSNLCEHDLQRCTASVHHRQLLLQHSNICRNVDLLTSTPSLLIGKRRSMSPITKSTQRMPKSMQESIMTPRSRKPVMVITNNANGSDQNQTICQADLSSFREQDEDESFVSHTELKEIPNNHTEINNSVTSESVGYVSKDSSKLPINEVMNSINNSFDALDSENALTSDFKEYLRSRSVLTTSPADLSFSSHPDDFDSSGEIKDINRSELSKSLLFCLDGNEPDDEVKDYAVDTPCSGSVNRMETMLVQSDKFLGSSRKRELSIDLNEMEATNLSEGLTVNMENIENIDKYLLTKKSFITEHPGETSF